MESNFIEIKVTKLTQGKVTEYIGKIRSKDILSLYDIKKFSETELDGYQRELYRERQREIAEYIEDCPIPIIPALLASIREDSVFELKEMGEQGTLKIPRKRGSVMLIDGQHRISGFDLIFDKLNEIDKQLRLGIDVNNYQSKIDKYNKILDFEIPILFIDSKNAADILDKEKKPEGAKIKQVKPDDVESVIFYIVNKTQKGIRPSLQDTLQFMIYRAGIRGIPSIEKDPWRVEATEVGHRLNSSESPLTGKISLSGARGLGRPIQLNSWVSSLEPLYKEDDFNTLSRDEQYNYIESYWRIIKQLFPNEFEDKKNYLLLKSIGVYSLNWLASDIFKWLKIKKMPINEQTIKEYLSSLKSFNWKNKDPGASKLRGLGGQAGVKEAYKILLENLKIAGIKESEEQLNTLT